MNSILLLFNKELRIDSDKKLLLEYIRNMEVEKVEELLKSGVKPIRGFHLWKEYESPIVEAVRTKSAVLVELLLSYGAPVNEEGISYVTPLQMACSVNSNSNGGNIIKK
jgi:ankyrin repeat protein